MTTSTFFILFIPILAILLLLINLILSPHNSYQEKNSTFECGFHSFLGQNRTQFSISFFIFGLLFLLFDLEILLVYPYSVSAYSTDIYGLIVTMLFFIILTLGFIFELGKNALSIESKQIYSFFDWWLFNNIPKPYVFTCFILRNSVPWFLSIFFVFIYTMGNNYTSGNSILDVFIQIITITSIILLILLISLLYLLFKLIIYVLVFVYIILDLFIWLWCNIPIDETSINILLLIPLCSCMLKFAIASSNVNNITWIHIGALIYRTIVQLSVNILIRYPIRNYLLCLLSSNPITFFLLIIIINLLVTWLVNKLLDKLLEKLDYIFIVIYTIKVIIFNLDEALIPLGLGVNLNGIVYMVRWAFNRANDEAAMEAVRWCFRAEQESRSSMILSEKYNTLANIFSRQGMTNMSDVFRQTARDEARRARFIDRDRIQELENVCNLYTTAIIIE